MDDERFEDAWGVNGRKVQCDSCDSTGMIDGEPCPGCLGFGWLSTPIEE